MKIRHFFALTIFACLSPSLRADDPTPAPPPTTVKSDGRVAFTLTAPNAKEVILRGQWKKEPIAMTRGEKGDWSVTLDAVPAGVWEYSFAVDGLNVMDPHNPSFKPQREPGKSILQISSNPPAAWDWQDVPHGTVHTHSYLSKVLGRPREVVVYTPPGYETDAAKKYPLLVLQHGSGDNQRTWVEHGKANWIFDNLIAQKKAVPMVVMMIDGHANPPGTKPGERGAAAEAFQRELLEDAMPLVDSIYRVEKDRSQRAITGLSMGGAQSLSVGLGQIDQFAWVGSFSGAPPAQPIMDKFLADPAAANSKLRLLWMAVGKDDFLRKRNEDLDAAFTAKGIHHTFKLSEGDHSWPVWRNYLTEFAPLLFQEAK